MKVVGICGSPGKGNAEFMLRTVLDNAKENGAEIDLILLSELNIEFVGKEKDDDFNKILPKIIEADAIVFSSPCYYDMITPQLLNIIDRLDQSADSLKNKKVGIIIVGKEDYESSAKNAIDYLKRVSDIYEMKVVGSVFGRAENPEDSSKDTELISQLKELGKKLYE